MNQAFLGAEINKGYIDIAISNNQNIFKKLVYFDIQHSFEELVIEIDKLFSTKIDVLHCGFISNVFSENHWVFNISNLKHNIIFHKVSSVNVLKELNKLTDENLTPTLICNYLKIHSNNTKKPIPFEKRINDSNIDINRSIIINSHKSANVLNSYTAKTKKTQLKQEVKTFKTEILKEKQKRYSETKSNKKNEINYFSDYNSLILETKENLLYQLKQIIRKTIPEAISYIKETPNNWNFKILKKYPSQEKINKARIKNIIKVCPKNKQELIDFIAAVKLGVAIEKNTKLEYLIKTICNDLIEIDSKNKKVESYIKRSYKHVYLEKLKFLKNVDRFLTVFLIEEIGNINRFETVDDMTTNFGVHINENKKTELKNKKSNSEYKAILNRIVKKVITSNSYFKQMYKQKIALKFSHKKAIEFVEFKMTRIIYSLLKDTNVKNKKENNNKPSSMIIKSKTIAKQAEMTNKKIFIEI